MVSDLEASARHWEALADEQERLREIDVAAGHHPAANDARIETYRRAARANRLEESTGAAHCVCCLKPMSLAHGRK